MRPVKQERTVGPDFWEYDNPYYKPEYKSWWVKGKEGGMHETYFSYNEPIEYKGFQIFPRIKHTNPDACVCDVLDDGLVITQRVTVNSCKRYIDSLTPTRES